MATFLARRRDAGRRAFTLIELLVVMVIVGVLVALLLPVITGALRTARNSAVSADLQTLSQALASFQAKHGSYPPSRIMLSENGQYYMTPANAAKMVTSANGMSKTATDIRYSDLMQRSVTALRKLWPRMVISQTTTPVWATDSVQWYDFDGDGVFDTAPYILEGDEALVWGLGGVPLNTGTPAEPSWSMSGWSSNPLNPFGNALENGNTMFRGTRTAPFFEFKPERLRDMDEPTNDPVRFPSYHDALATNVPIVYFASYGSETYDPNDCNWGPLDSAGVAQAEADEVGTRPLLRQFRTTFPVYDSAGTFGRIAVSAAPNPYTSSTPLAVTAQWHKGQSYQLISAGRDGLYGMGGRYDPNSRTRLAPNDAAETDPDTLRSRPTESDNIANFSSGTLD